MPLPGDIIALKAQIHTDITTATAFHSITAAIHGADMEDICDQLLAVYSAIVSGTSTLDAVLGVGNVSNDKDMIFKGATGLTTLDFSASYGQINGDNGANRFLISGEAVLFYLDSGSVLLAGILVGSGTPQLILMDASSGFDAIDQAGILTAERTYKKPDGSGVYILDTMAQTLTNKRYVPRYASIAGGAVAVPTFNSDNIDVYEITAQTANITSFPITGTPTPGQSINITITAAANITIALGADYEPSTIPLPTSLISGVTTDLAFRWNTITSKWRIVGQV